MRRDPVPSQSVTAENKTTGDRAQTLPLIPIECVHMTSQRPCWMSKQRNGGHVGGVKYSFGSIFMQIPPFVSLCKYGASGHMSEHTL